MNWKAKNDDTYTAQFEDVQMEINFMRTHWGWIITDAGGVPLAGSFLNGVFPDTAAEAREYCQNYAQKYLANPIKYRGDLEDKMTEKFDMNITINGMQAIVVAMMLYENSRDGIHLSDCDITDQNTILDIHEISKSLIGQWKNFSENFELSRK